MRGSAPGHPYLAGQDEVALTQATDEVGPHGGTVWYSDAGDKYVLLTDDDPDEYPVAWLRSETTIKAVWEDLWDLVSYKRRLNRVFVDPRYAVQLPATDETRIEAVAERYGLDFCDLTDFEWGLLSGRLSSLAWVLGMDWDSSLDT